MMDKMTEIFLDEANDLLDKLEYLLLDLEENPTDAETVQAIFRSMHTIKGSSGMFGFNEISHFTHEVETAFDEVRNGRAAVTKPLISLTLKTRDHLRRLLVNENDSEVKSVSQQLIKQFQLYVKEHSTNAVKTDDEPAAKKENDGAEKIIDQKDTATWRIVFQPAPDIFMNGTHPHALLAELARMGNASISVFTHTIPILSELDPQQCYVSWEIMLTTTEDHNSLQDVFIFLNSSNTVTITKITPDNIFDVSVHAKKQQESHTQTIKVNSEKLDKLIDLVGELVTFNARLGLLAQNMQNSTLTALGEQGERLILELRDTTMDMRMVPIGTIFSRFRRLVRDLSAELGKNIELLTEGGDTELDKTVIEKLNDPLVHLIRNSVDHGIEPPDIRQKNGKAVTGVVSLKAQHAGGFVLLTIEDDGAGLNKEKICQKALEKNLIAPTDELSDAAIGELIFLPGFSTAQKVTAVSGRGVGMDVVKKDVTALGGTVSVTTKTGFGSKFTLKLPLTLAIIEGVLVKIGTRHFVIPLSNIVECLEFSRPKKVKICSSLNLRNDMIPYIDLRTFFAIEGEPPAIEHIAIVTDQDTRIGLVIDKVIGNYQTVIKPLGRFYNYVSGISGATILGDGSLALIIDVYKLSDCIKQIDTYTI